MATKVAILLSILANTAIVSGCVNPMREYPHTKDVESQRQRAMQAWESRCRNSGEFIHQKVNDIDGIFLMNVRMRTNMGESLSDQYALDDPYGNDLANEAYITSLLRGSFFYHYIAVSQVPKGWQPHLGYKFIEAIDPKDGVLYRYTGRVIDIAERSTSRPGESGKYVVEKFPIPARTTRYGVRFRDISTLEDRRLWIAASSLQVIDLESQSIIAERVGYMVDWAQGSRTGGRLPWLFAAEYACPDFSRDFPAADRLSTHKNRHQVRQTQRFVEKVLKPAY